MNKNLTLTIVHLYPQEMNIYGDMGNIITLTQRARWRNIKVYYKTVHKGDKKLPEGDIYFMGGGQDNDMFSVFDDLIEYKKDFINKEFNSGKVFLLICGAFQLFGEYFLDAQGRKIEGLGIIPVETIAPGDQLKNRCLGNIVTKLNPDLRAKIVNNYHGRFKDTIVGFENHSGQTFFTNKSIKPMGDVLIGRGNNSKEGVEGTAFFNIFGSYTHGSLLPKNPHLADLLLSLALEKKYNKKIYLSQIDDSIEWLAHDKAIERSK